uniref:Uncharacterized protein n=1 Tax=Cacopsylla melanoneura TaxID=428564 RepID=A0A8D8TN44_9HEMI
MLLDPLIEAVNSKSSETSLVINRRNVRKDIKVEAARLRDIIKKEAKGKLICIKVDTASRMDRHVLSLNIQYAEGGRLILRNIGMMEMIESHTAINLENEIVRMLSACGISSDMVFSGTADNAANITKAVVRLGHSEKPILVQHTCYHTPFADEDESDNEEDDEERSTTHTTEVQQSDDISDSSDEEFFHNESTPLSTFTSPTLCPDCEKVKTALDVMGVLSVHCAAHTLQLAVHDAIRNTGEFRGLIDKARRMVKLLRTPNYYKILKREGRAKPPLDVDTRWNSSYEMLKSLYSLRALCVAIRTKEVDLDKAKKRKNKETRSKGQFMRL